MQNKEGTMSSKVREADKTEAFLEEQWEACIDWGGQYSQEMKVLDFRSDQSRQRKVMGYERNWTSKVALVLKNPPPNAGDIRDLV